MGMLVEWLIMNVDMLTRWLVVTLSILTIGSGLFGFIRSEEWKLSDRLLEGLMLMLSVPTAVVVGLGVIGLCLWGIWWGIWG